MVFLTAQQATGKGRTNIARYASQSCTMVIYMPAGHYREIRGDLVAAGLPLDTPCVVAANASRPNQELLWTELTALGSTSMPESPALIIIGPVARGWDAPGVGLIDFSRCRKPYRGGAIGPITKQFTASNYVGILFDVSSAQSV